MMIDVLLLAVIAISALLGLLRGFLASISSLLSWLLAVWAALRFGNEAAYWFANTAELTLWQRCGGYVAVFLAALLLASLLGMVLRNVVNSTELLKTPDRALGLGFGVIRGVVLAALALVLLRLTPLAEQAPWHESQAVAWLAPMPSLAQMPLPEELRRFQQSLPSQLPTAVPASSDHNTVIDGSVMERIQALATGTAAPPPDL